jgi:hypothetical protein
MILFNQIVQVFRRPQFRPFAVPMFAEELPGRAMRRLIAVECDGPRQSALALERSAEKSFRRGDIPLCAQQKIDGLSVTINCAIQIGPAAFDLQVGFIDSPRSSSVARKTISAFHELGSVALNPPHDRRVREINAAFGHHLDEIPETQFEPEIPANAKNNDLPVEMASLEKLFDAQHVDPRPPTAFDGQYARLPLVAPEPTKARRADKVGEGHAGALT